MELSLAPFLHGCCKARAKKPLSVVIGSYPEWNCCNQAEICRLSANAEYKWLQGHRNPIRLLRYRSVQRNLYNLHVDVETGHGTGGAHTGRSPIRRGEHTRL